MDRDEIRNFLNSVKAAFQSFSLTEAVVDVWFSKLQLAGAREAKAALNALIDQGAEKSPSLGQVVKLIPSLTQERRRLKEFYEREGCRYLRITTFKPGSSAPEVREYFEGLVDARGRDAEEKALKDAGYEKKREPHPQGFVEFWGYRGL